MTTYCIPVDYLRLESSNGWWFENAEGEGCYISKTIANRLPNMTSDLLIEVPDWLIIPPLAEFRDTTIELGDIG